jgi:hypothetical protein
VVENLNASVPEEKGPRVKGFEEKSDEFGAVFMCDL